MSVNILFLPDRVATTAQPGEALLDVANRAGVKIPTGCLKGVCYMCKVAFEGHEDPVRACLVTVPTDELSIVHLFAANN
jgi:ferredoxin